jgi:hypothetical protein
MRYRTVTLKVWSTIEKRPLYSAKLGNGRGCYAYDDYESAIMAATKQFIKALKKQSRTSCTRYTGAH